MDVVTIALACAATLVVLALGVWGGSAASSAANRPAATTATRAERILTAEQAHMLDYLQDTFPGQVVLPNMMLADMLTVRRAADRKRAEERLGEQRGGLRRVRPGRPAQLRVRHRATPPERRQGQGAQGQDEEPDPQERGRAFRVPEERHPPACRPRPTSAPSSTWPNCPNPGPRRTSARAPCSSWRASSRSSTSSTAATPASASRKFMGMSGLMDLNRQMGRHSRLNGHGDFDSGRKPGDSGFDGSSLDVRGR
jgi:hypothetical protein